MSDFCFIQSTNELDAADVATNVEIARNLAKQGHAVTLFLVQNAVMSARRGARARAITSAIDAGISVLADDFSLRERGIPGDELAPDISPASLEFVVDALAAGSRTLWH